MRHPAYLRARSAEPSQGDAVTDGWLTILTSAETVVAAQRAPRFSGRNNQHAAKAIIATCLRTGRRYEFKSATEAARALGCTTWGISNVLRGRQRKSGGYKWALMP